METPDGEIWAAVNHMSGREKKMPVLEEEVMVIGKKVNKYNNDVVNLYFSLE